ncbi:hypothetical protein FOA52_003751 [Chlamydomonas sp. UWO 241]|nr:hypothetical protein FOA52_003751 [Chlamydomonas sp. UWO 241]
MSDGGDFDAEAEAEWERELALLGTGDAHGGGDDTVLLEPLSLEPLSFPLAQLSDDDDDESGDDGDESEPLRLLREAMSRQDQQLSTFKAELASAQDAVAVAAAAARAPGAELGSTLLPGEYGSDGGDGSGGGGTEEYGQGDAGAPHDGDSSAVGGAARTGGAAAAAAAPVDVAAAVHGLQELVALQALHGVGSLGDGDADAQPDSRPALTGFAANEAQAGASGCATPSATDADAAAAARGAGGSVPSADGFTAAVMERQAARETYQRDEAERVAGRDAVRADAAARARRDADEAEARLRADEGARAQAHAALVARLEEQAAAAARVRAAAEAAEAARAERWERERAERQARAAEMAAESAARERQLAVMVREVEDGVVKCARAHLAAARMWRAWAAYRGSPARAARLAAITTLQAAVRARAARREGARLAGQRDVRQRLEDAAARGQLGAAKDALVLAQSVGLGNEVSARLAAMEAATAALGAAAVQGMRPAAY